ncbi:3511_t:CDS:2 [Funneliformis mosseae]|uniref:3511_t:CDS:1 n=1 Tax=Funneliformis mosseae TaxID=27381 RepID=A0A9N9BCS3_FUNMO|nr:3511_t:CDS:2 [Funneliformis mosseae]
MVIENLKLTYHLNAYPICLICIEYNELYRESNKSKKLAEVNTAKFLKDILNEIIKLLLNNSTSINILPQDILLSNDSKIEPVK